MFLNKSSLEIKVLTANRSHRVRGIIKFGGIIRTSLNKK